MAELAGAAGDSAITELRHVRATVEKRAAEEIAQRKKCEDFEAFGPLFETVKRDLKSGVRQTLPAHRLDEIKLAEISKSRHSGMLSPAFFRAADHEITCW